ncbi:response regulator, partial [uncultured Duncaniella sp.]|uniref:response regulator n=1 Tax=uncultured Duncaniella sp. TaxID=2768039 RepID=UPI0026F0CFD3
MYRILIIDDSPADCEDLGRKLACFDVEKVTAMSLKSAKELLKKSSYRDIIICDYKLTDGTSVELLEWLAKNRIYRDVIVVSDMLDNPLSIEAFRAGAKDYIQKRQTDQLLIPRLKRLIG